MSINGVDVTASFAMVFGTIWIIGYLGFIFLVIRFRPKDIKQRRWKAALLVGGLPVLGLPIFLSATLLVIFLLQIGQSNINTPTFPENLADFFISIGTIAICSFPFSALLAIPATFGTHNRLQESEVWLNKIVPPNKDEQPNVHEYM